MDLDIYRGFFKNKRVLITGNTGFVGAYLSLTLTMLGSKILGYSLKKKIQDIFQIQKNIKKLKQFMMT